MSTAVLILADQNLRGLQNALFAWHDVDGIEETKFVVAIQPGPLQQHIAEEVEEFVHHRGLTRYEILVLEGRLEYQMQLDLMLAKLWDEGFDTVWEAAEDEVPARDVLTS